MLLTCVNVAGLVLARALRRGREFALRSALGGGSGALIRQLLVEGALLALPGGCARAAPDDVGRAHSVAAPPAGLPRAAVRFQWTRASRLAAFALAGLTAVVFGLVPALFARRADLSVDAGPWRTDGRPIARTGAGAACAARRASGRDRRASRRRRTLCQELLRLTQIPIGFDRRDAVALRVSLTGPRYASDAQVRGYAAALLEQTRALPGVRDAAIGSSTPLNSGPMVFFVVARPAEARAQRRTEGDSAKQRRRSTSGRSASRLTAGRGFARRRHRRRSSRGDREQDTRDPAVSRRGPDRACHRAHSRGARGPWTRHPGRLTIVGVAANVKELGFNEVEFNGIFVPFAQMAAPAFDFVARTGVPAATVIPALRAAAAASTHARRVSASRPSSSASTMRFARTGSTW